MRFYPDKHEINIAVNLLVNEYNISTQKLNRMFGLRGQADSILSKLDGRRLEKHDVARLLVLRYGPGLLGGADNEKKDLRYILLKQLPDSAIDELYDQHPSNNKTLRSIGHRRRYLSEMKWHPSGPWPKHFVDALGFPRIFAGVRQRDTLPTVECVHPKSPIPKLKPFQEDMKEQMLSVMDGHYNKKHCVITLPTGGGKTRVAVEAFIDWMHERFSEGKYLVWIAQSEELCEQALIHVKQMWQEREYVSPLLVYRYFGGRDVNPAHLDGGAVVGSIQQLHNRIKSRDPALDQILSNTGVMIIDEAHRAVSSMYDNVFQRASELCGPDPFSVCGLTATPGRAGLRGEVETKKLVNRFDAHLVKPGLDPSYRANPLEFFREKGYLARPRHIIYESGREYELSDRELMEYDRDHDLPQCFLKRLAEDQRRNQSIINRLLEIEKGTPTLVYACTVKHAHLLSVILNMKDRSSGAISSKTSLTIRRGLIDQFKKGEVHFLINFGVLTTGFDAPKTECIVICRPTTSEVLYEQIVGRGMRGPEFGGTETCRVIDFSDNIHRLGGQMAYKRFEYFWCEEMAPALV